MRFATWIPILVVLGMSVSFTSAQETTESIPSEVVNIEAADGLILVGDFYLSNAEEPAPAVLLLHMLGSDRNAWRQLIPELTASN
ncbi:hypothetical protein HC928_25350 [bacterium]|nr:hypothetical protein [bacterium]